MSLERNFRQRVLGLFDHRLVIYRWEAGAVPVASAAITPQTFRAIDELPDTVFAESGSGGLPRQWYEGLFAQGAILWTAIEDGKALCSLWVISAEQLGQWWVALPARDKVIYAVATDAAARGKGLAPRLVLAACEAEAEDDARIHLDCKIWNRAARRAFAKVGFREIARVDPDDGMQPCQ